MVIEKAWDLHQEEKAQMKKEGKLHPGTVLFIFTDGAPTNRAAVERSIVKIASVIDRHDEFNIGILKVGTVDPELEKWLSDL